MLLAVVNWENWPGSNLCLGLGEKRADPGGLLWNTHRSLSFWLLTLISRDGALGVAKGMTSCTLDVTCVSRHSADCAQFLGSTL